MDDMPAPHVMNPSDQDSALTIRRLRRIFGEKVAVDDVDLTVDAGSFTGLLGPNGAGKSTLIGCAVDFDRPDAGVSAVFGHDVWEAPNQARRLMGCCRTTWHFRSTCPAENCLVTGADCTAWSRQWWMPAPRSCSACSSWTGPRNGPWCSTTPPVYAKKIGLAVALIHRPRLLVPDEPFEAIDPLSAIVIRQILEQFITSGGSIIMSSHTMLLVEQICDSVAIMASGRIVLSEAISEIHCRGSLEEAFVHAAGSAESLVPRELSWLV